jgi:hypothetical protein
MELNMTNDMCGIEGIREPIQGSVEKIKDPSPQGGCPGLELANAFGVLLVIGGNVDGQVGMTTPVLPSPR